MNLTKQQLDHLRNAQELAAKADREFTSAGLPPMMFSTSIEIGRWLQGASDMILEILRRYTGRP